MRLRKKKRWTSAAARRIMELAGGDVSVEQAVETVANRLLHGVAAPPTDLESVSKRLNVKSFHEVLNLPISGQLKHDGDGFIVEYSSSLSPVRRRFTIAHELAHAVFEMTGRNCPRNGRELERICDMLAGELLFPRHLFVPRIGAGLVARQILQLAREFDASVMATALRCSQLVNASVFLVEERRISWGYGRIRRESDMLSDVSTFESAITDAMAGNSGSRTAYLGASKYSLEWACFPKQPRALFVMQPA